MTDEPEHIRRRRVAQPGIRRVRFCTECHRRQFLKPSDPTWDCPEHGKSKTIWQPNKPYFGQDTTGPNWPEPLKPSEPEPPEAA